MSDVDATDGEQRDEDFEAYEEKLDELTEGLLEAYTAGYQKAMRDYDAEPDPERMDGSGYIAESHYYYWDGKTKPLEPWLRDLFLDDEQLVTDGGEVKGALPHAVTKRSDDPEARKVWVEMYPGGDAMIELGGIRSDEELYLSSGEPEALLEALEELIERKEGEE